MQPEWTRDEKLNDYDGFVDKFKPKLTTDDCFTPPVIYECVKEWACNRFGIDPGTIVRPFYPGGDYESYEYPDGCTVLDNPPFSMLAKICTNYLDRGINFFLFAPALTGFSSAATTMRTNHIFIGTQVKYENGALVNTSFITNYGENVAETAPELGEAIRRIQTAEVGKVKKQLPKYSYPDNVVTAAMLGKYARRGIPFTVPKDDCRPIKRLDCQKRLGKTIFGGGLLIGTEKAAERGAAERAAEREAEREAAEPTPFSLSAREIDLVRQIGGHQ